MKAHPDMPLRDRLLARVEKNGDCWIWTGGKERGGYGMIHLPRSRSKAMAHRVAFEIFIAPIPAGMTVDHTCFVPACVNPDHLRLMAPRDNAARQRRALATHCKNGHEWTPENTRRRPAGQGQRACRACNRDAVARYKARRSVL